MENYRQTKRFEWFVRLSVLFLVTLICVSVFSFIKLSKARKQDAEYNNMIASLKLENQRVNSSIEDMTSYDYLEQQARKNLGMIKGDEKHIEFK